MTTPIRTDRPIYLFTWIMTAVGIICLTIWFSTEHASMMLIRYENLKEQKHANQHRIATLEHQIASAKLEIHEHEITIVNNSTAPTQEAAQAKESRETHIQKYRTRIQELTTQIEAYAKQKATGEADVALIQADMKRISN